MLHLSTSQSIPVFARPPESVLTRVDLVLVLVYLHLLVRVHALWVAHVVFAMTNDN